MYSSICFFESVSLLICLNSSAHNEKLRSSSFCRRFCENVIEEEAFELHDKMIKKVLRKVTCCKQQDVMQAKSAATKPFEVIHLQVVLAIISTTRGVIYKAINILHNMLNKFEGLVLIVT